MRIVTEKLVFDVEERGPRDFLLTPVSCSCEDQSEPSTFDCEEDENVKHGCSHPSSGSIELEEFDVKIGRQIAFECQVFCGLVLSVKLGPDMQCCKKNSNRVLEIIP